MEQQPPPPIILPPNVCASFPKGDFGGICQHPFKWKGEKMWRGDCLMNDGKLYGMRDGDITVLVEMLFCLLIPYFLIVNCSADLRNTLSIRKLSPQIRAQHVELRTANTLPA